MSRAIADEWYIRLLPIDPDRSSSSHVEKVFTLRQLLFSTDPLEHDEDIGVNSSTTPLLVAGGVVLGRDKTDAHKRDVGSVDCPIVSRQHAQFLVNDYGQVYLVDLGSHHGTYLCSENCDAVTDSIKLRSRVVHRVLHGDTIILGKSVTDSTRGRFEALRYRVEFRYPEFGELSGLCTERQKGPVDSNTVRGDFTSTAGLGTVEHYVRLSSSWEQDSRVEKATGDHTNDDINASAELPESDGEDGDSDAGSTDYRDMDWFSETGWDSGSDSLSSPKSPAACQQGGDQDDRNSDIVPLNLDKIDTDDVPEVTFIGEVDASSKIVPPIVVEDDDDEEEQPQSQHAGVYGVPPSVLYQSDDEPELEREQRCLSDTTSLEGLGAPGGERAAPSANYLVNSEIPPSPRMNPIIPEAQVTMAARRDTIEMMDDYDGENDQEEDFGSARNTDSDAFQMLPSIVPRGAVRDVISVGEVRRTESVVAFSARQVVDEVAIRRQEMANRILALSARLETEAYLPGGSNEVTTSDLERFEAAVARPASAMESHSVIGSVKSANDEQDRNMSIPSHSTSPVTPRADEPSRLAPSPLTTDSFDVSASGHDDSKPNAAIQMASTESDDEQWDADYGKFYSYSEDEESADSEEAASEAGSDFSDRSVADSSEYTGDEDDQSLTSLDEDDEDDDENDEEEDEEKGYGDDKEEQVVDEDEDCDEEAEFSDEEEKKNDFYGEEYGNRKEVTPEEDILHVKQKKLSGKSSSTTVTPVKPVASSLVVNLDRLQPDLVPQQLKDEEPLAVEELVFKEQAKANAGMDVAVTSVVEMKDSAMQTVDLERASDVELRQNKVTEVAASADNNEADSAPDNVLLSDRATTPTHSDASSTGPITPTTSTVVPLPSPTSLKRKYDETDGDEHDSTTSTISTRTIIIERPAKRRSVGSTIGLVMLGAALGSVGTIAGLMQIAP